MFIFNKCSTAFCRQAILVLLVGSVSAFLPWDVNAEQPRDVLYFQTVPSTEAMAEHLFGQPKKPLSRSRGVVFAEPESSSEKENQSTEKSVGLPVLFHFGKTTLVDSSMPYLDKVGDLMLQDEYREETLVIEGHTDAVGTDASNLLLSKLRALAVKDYLVAEYGIDPLRLFPSGKGEAQLFDANDPKAGVNRRVEFLRYER